jgi:hypothetical protein
VADHIHHRRGPIEYSELICRNIFTWRNQCHGFKLNQLPYKAALYFPHFGVCGGYRFWLNKLNQFNGNFVQAEMVKAFIVSGEYRDRFLR